MTGSTPGSLSSEDRLEVEVAVPVQRFEPPHADAQPVDRRDLHLVQADRVRPVGRPRGEHAHPRPGSGSPRVDDQHIRLRSVKPRQHEDLLPGAEASQALTHTGFEHEPRFRGTFVRLARCRFLIGSGDSTPPISSTSERRIFPPWVQARVIAGSPCAVSIIMDRRNPARESGAANHHPAHQEPGHPEPSAPGGIGYREVRAKTAFMRIIRFVSPNAFTIWPGSLTARATSSRMGGLCVLLLERRAAAGDEDVSIEHRMAPSLNECPGIASSRYRGSSQ